MTSKPKSIQAAAARGELSGLRALRDDLASMLDGDLTVEDRVRVSGRLAEVLKRIDELEPPKQRALGDALAERRRQRAADRAAKANSG